MVCPRCIAAVEQIFSKNEIKVLTINLGEVLIADNLTIKQTEALSEQLRLMGFELLDDNKKKQIEKIKSTVINYIHHKEEIINNFSVILSEALNKEYSQLSKLFSSTEGITIEQFVILQKIEKAKEYIVYNEMNLSEIAFKLGYSSVAHISSQFKKITGLTPTEFKSLTIHHRKSLDSV